MSRDLVAVARERAVSCSTNVPGRTLAGLLTELADEVEALRDERDAALSRAEQAERHHRDARFAASAAQDERNRVSATLTRVRVLAAEWANQPNPHHIDTRFRQIEDGRALLALIDGHTPEPTTTPEESL